MLAMVDDDKSSTSKIDGGTGLSLVARIPLVIARFCAGTAIDKHSKV